MPVRRRGLTIGAVLEDLQPEFPDLTVSKIRFLESEGLVTPTRAPSGYRTFSTSDVERLRYILTAQRDRFWPLRVIREALDALDRGLTPPDSQDPAGRPTAPAPALDPDVPSAADLAARSPVRLTESELVEASGLSGSMCAALVTYGLLSPGTDGHYDEASLAVARAAGALASYGVEARHLRPFRSAADREIGLVQQIVTPARVASARRGHDTTPDPTADVLHHCLALHAALVKAALAPRRTSAPR